MSFESRRELVRARALSSMSRWYNPWLHLGATMSIGLAVLAVALARLSDVRPLEWLVIPVVFVMANGFEWRVHKDVLHRRRRLLEVIYDRHTPQHHMIYTTADMEVRSTREFRLVMIPAFGVAGAVLVTAPWALLFAKVWSANAGWLLLVTASLYMVSYELFHLAYHLPATNPIGRIGVIRRLREHHAWHHDPRLMQRWNFNVTVPLFDWIHGTIAPKELTDRVGATPLASSDMLKEANAGALEEATGKA